jgi:hypothetical protein
MKWAGLQAPTLTREMWLNSPDLDAFSLFSTNLATLPLHCLLRSQLAKKPITFAVRTGREV